MEDKEFIGNIFPQNCGDDLKVLKRTNIRKNKIILYECEFIKYPYKCLVEKSNVLRKSILNPKIEQVEFINKIWPQRCGDSLKILGKASENEYKRSNKRLNIPFKCEFIKYPCIIYEQKQHIIKGNVLNPKLEELFCSSLHIQSNNECLKILYKTDKLSRDKSYLYKCEFQKYKFIIEATKSEILRGTLINPQIEQVEFIDKIWPQNCGDSLKILRKAKEKNYWECEFTKYPYKVISKKCHIIKGNVLNPKCPNFYKSKGELELLSYIRLLLNDNTISNTYKILKNQEIDIYIPKLKIGFEFNGNFWHSNDNKYGVLRDYHLKKSLLAKEKGIQLIHIWEDEWNLNKTRLKIWIKNKIFNFNDYLFFEKLENNFIKIDLSKEPQYLDDISICPVPIKRGNNIVYNCGYTIKFKKI